eukprot:scaffold118_cov382-Prasinococcus_capsulatus_cf.AAC.5
MVGETLCGATWHGVGPHLRRARWQGRAACSLRWTRSGSPAPPARSRDAPRCLTGSTAAGTAAAPAYTKRCRRVDPAQGPKRKAPRPARGSYASLPVILGHRLLGHHADHVSDGAAHIPLRVIQEQLQEGLLDVGAAPPPADAAMGLSCVAGRTPEAAAAPRDAWMPSSIAPPPAAPSHQPSQ